MVDGDEGQWVVTMDSGWWATNNRQYMADSEWWTMGEGQWVVENVR